MRCSLFAAAAVPDDRGGADDRGGLRRQPALRRAARPRSCACSPASAGSTSCAPPAARFGRAARGGAGRRARGRRGAPFLVADLDEISDGVEQDPLGGRLLRHAAGRRSPRPAGSTRSERCKVYTGHFQVPAVAWYLQDAHRRDRHRPQAAGHRDRAARLAARRATSASRCSRRPASGSCGAPATPERPSILRAAWRPTSRARRGSCGSGRSRPRGSLVPVGLGLLVALSLGVKDAELNVGYWIDEGLSVGIADRPLTDIPGILRQDGSPPLYYGLLHVWMSLVGQRRAGDAHAVAAVRARDRPGRVLGRGARVRPPRGVVRRGARRAQPVHLAVRAGDADVLARRAAGHARDGRCSCAPTPPTSAPRGAGRCCSGSSLAADALHPQLGALLRRRDVRRLARAALRWRPRPSAGGGCATARSASG